VGWALILDPLAIYQTIQVDGTLKEITIALDNLHKWVQPKTKSVPLMHMPGTGLVVKEPYGLVLIIAPVPRTLVCSCALALLR